MSISRNQIQEAAEHHLRNGRLLHLATQSNSVLWMCHVWYAIGENLNELIFTSNKSRRHSVEIADSALVSGGIVPGVTTGLGAAVRGGWCAGRAHRRGGRRAWPEAR